MVTINNYDEFAAYLGKNLGVSDYVELSQERINLSHNLTFGNSSYRRVATHHGSLGKVESYK